MIKDLTVEKAKGRVLLLDEIDYMIDNDSIYPTFSNNVLSIKGLVCALHAKKTYMLSATMETFHLEYLLHIFGLLKSQHTKYKSMHELMNTNDFSESMLIKQLFQTIEQVEDALIKQLKEHAGTRPILLFLEVNEKMFDELLRKVAK